MIPTYSAILLRQVAIILRFAPAFPKSRPRTFYISVILLNELLRRVQPQIQRAGNTPAIVKAYAALSQLIMAIMPFQILPFDESAHTEFMKISQGIRQAHPNDCRVAAIAISRELTVVARNTRHFEKIPGVKFEDWTLEPE